MSLPALKRFWIPLAFVCALIAFLVTVFVATLVPFGWLSRIGVFALLLAAVAHPFLHAKGLALQRDHGR